MFIDKLYINMAIAVILSQDQSLYDLPEPIYKDKACAQPQKKGMADIAMTPQKYRSGVKAIFFLNGLKDPSPLRNWYKHG